MADETTLFSGTTANGGTRTTVWLSRSPDGGISIQAKTPLCRLLRSGSRFQAGSQRRAHKETQASGVRQAAFGAASTTDSRQGPPHGIQGASRGRLRTPSGMA